MKNFIAENQNYKDYQAIFRTNHLLAFSEKGEEFINSAFHVQLNELRNTFLLKAFDEIIVLAREQSESLIQHASILNEKGRKVVILALKDKKSFEEIAKEITLSEFRTKQIFLRDLNKLLRSQK